jgi:hypothetical protein
MRCRIDVVLQRDGNAVQRPAKFTRLGFRIECCRLRQRFLAHHCDEAVELGRVDRNAIEACRGQLSRRHLACMDHRACLGQGERSQFIAACGLCCRSQLAKKCFRNEGAAREHAKFTPSDIHFRTLLRGRKGTQLHPSMD